MRAPTWAVWAALSACTPRDAVRSTDGSDAGADPGACAGADAGAGAGADTGPGADAGAGSPSRDGGSACRLLSGPVALSGRGGVALASRGDDMLAVLNDDGHPSVATFHVGPLGSRPLAAVPAAAASNARAMRVPCAVTGNLAFCPDRSGVVHRSTLEGGDFKRVASSRPGTKVSAARLGNQVPVLVYLASRKTSEGWVSEAWITTEEGLPERLSEDGSGATSSSLAARGSSLVAVTVDSRVALTAMHAREIHYDHGLRMAEDVVTFVGGPGDPGSAATAALLPSGAAWALLPIARDISSFGLAIVKLDDPPRVDEPVVWAMYPDGLDPAPVATVVAAGRAWVARLRPRSPGPGAPRDLEVGELGLDGFFAARQVVSGAGGATDVALAADARGALWLAWLDGSGSWVERLTCP